MCCFQLFLGTRKSSDTGSVITFQRYIVWMLKLLNVWNCANLRWTLLFFFFAECMKLYKSEVKITLLVFFCQYCIVNCICWFLLYKGMHSPFAHAEKMACSFMSFLLWYCASVTRFVIHSRLVYKHNLVKILWCWKDLNMSIMEFIKLFLLPTKVYKYDFFLFVVRELNLQNKAHWHGLLCLLVVYMCPHVILALRFL